MDDRGLDSKSKREQGRGGSLDCERDGLEESCESDFEAERRSGLPSGNRGRAS